MDNQHYFDLAGAKYKPNRKREATSGSCGTAGQRIRTFIPTGVTIKPPSESWLYLKLLLDLLALEKDTYSYTFCPAKGDQPMLKRVSIMSHRNPLPDPVSIHLKLQELRGT